MEGKPDMMNGLRFEYCPYGVNSYRCILGDYAFTLIDGHADIGKNSYYLAKKN